MIGTTLFHNTIRRVTRVQTIGLLLLLVFGTLGVGQLVALEARSPALEPTLHARAMDRAARLPRLRGLLISIDGRLVEEQYFRGARSWDWVNLKSASKSIVSTLVGIALDQGYLESLQDTIVEFFPEYLDPTDDLSKKTITLEDLLTMRSGLETTSNRNYGRWVQSSNWVRHVLTRRMVGKPGGRMIYSTGSSPPAFSGVDQGDRDEHPGLRSSLPGPTARYPDPFLDARPAGDLLRR